VSTLTEIKAEAVALHVLGHPCRGIEKMLKAKFPNEDIPNYGTINRWVRVLGSHAPTAPVRRLRNRHTIMRWWEAVARAAEIVHDRMDAEMKSVPYNKVPMMYSRMMDVVINLERLNREDRNG
jgi:hypothetical protein